MQLEYSWNLKETINNLKIAIELKEEINKYIMKEDKESTGIDHRFSNLVYRSNLQYIVDNVNKPGLLNELKTLND